MVGALTGQTEQVPILTAISAGSITMAHVLRSVTTAGFSRFSPEPRPAFEHSGNLRPDRQIGGLPMDLVLGLSMTSTAVRWVLVEGTTGGGAPIDRGALDIAAMASFDADGLLDALLDDDETVAEGRVHAIGVTWTSEAEAAASAVLQALADRGVANVIAVSDIEAADALADGIADITAYDDVAVCIVEPDAAVVAMVNADGMTVDRIDRPLDRADVVELTSSVMAIVDLNDWRPDAIFVLGSDDLDLIVSSLAGTAVSPVISAAEADLALARGAALASALAVNNMDAQAAPARRLRLSRVGALTSVLVAAVVTFVVALSVALGLRFAPDSGSEHIANAADEAARVATPPSVARADPNRRPLPHRHRRLPLRRHRRPLPHCRRHPRHRRSRRRLPRRRLRFPKPPLLLNRYTSRPRPHRLRPARVRAGRPAARGATARAGLCPARAAAGLCPRPGAQLRPAAGDLSEAATSRSDHRTHPDHQQIPRARTAIPAITTNSYRAVFAAEA